MIVKDHTRYQYNNSDAYDDQKILSKTLEQDDVTPRLFKSLPEVLKSARDSVWPNSGNRIFF